MEPSGRGQACRPPSSSRRPAAHSQTFSALMSAGTSCPASVRRPLANVTIDNAARQPPSSPSPTPAAFVMAGDRRADHGPTSIAPTRHGEGLPGRRILLCVGIRPGPPGSRSSWSRLFQVELGALRRRSRAPTPSPLDGQRPIAFPCSSATTCRWPCRVFAVVPLFAGYDFEADDAAKAGRIFSYDVTGGSLRGAQLPLPSAPEASFCPRCLEEAVPRRTSLEGPTPSPPPSRRCTTAADDDSGHRRTPT